jgi:hypothetical protein
MGGTLAVPEILEPAVALVEAFFRVRLLLLGKFRALRRLWLRGGGGRREGGCRTVAQRVCQQKVERGRNGRGEALTAVFAPFAAEEPPSPVHPP